MGLWKKICAGISLSFSLIFVWLWYEQYARWRGCFDEDGRCYEDGLVHLEQAGIAWGVCAGLSFLCFLVFYALIRLNK
ncbi:MAG: hypothetical protein JNK24_04200 [Alphaproteobacteria bacterium]|nr:hypothetical protein [Alphaproteobacteria bacterium]